MFLSWCLKVWGKQFSNQNTTLWRQNSVPWSPDQIPGLWSCEYRVWQSAQGISALFLMSVYAFSKRENWTTESLTEDQRVCLRLHPWKGHLPVERLTDPSRLQWSLLSPEPVAPFIFFCQQRSLFVPLPPMRKYSRDTDTIHLFIRKAWVYARWAEGITTCFLSHSDSMGLVWEPILFKKAASPDRIMSHSSWEESTLTNNIWGKGILGRIQWRSFKRQRSQDHWVSKRPPKLWEALISQQQEHGHFSLWLPGMAFLMLMRITSVNLNLRGTNWSSLSKGASDGIFTHPFIMYALNTYYISMC